MGFCLPSDHVNMIVAVRRLLVLASHARLGPALFPLLRSPSAGAIWLTAVIPISSSFIQVGAGIFTTASPSSLPAAGGLPSRRTVGKAGLRAADRTPTLTVAWPRASSFGRWDLVISGLPLWLCRLMGRVWRNSNLNSHFGGTSDLCPKLSGQLRSGEW